MGEGTGGGVPPEAEENGVHAQERETNCSLQLERKIRQCARMLIAADGRTRASARLLKLPVHGTGNKKIGTSPQSACYSQTLPRPNNVHVISRDPQ